MTTPAEGNHIPADAAVAGNDTKFGGRRKEMLSGSQTGAVIADHIPRLAAIEFRWDFLGVLFQPYDVERILVHPERPGIGRPSGAVIHAQGVSAAQEGRVEIEAQDGASTIVFWTGVRDSCCRAEE